MPGTVNSIIYQLKSPRCSTIYSLYCPYGIKSCRKTGRVDIAAKKLKHIPITESHDSRHRHQLSWSKEKSLKLWSECPKASFQFINAQLRQIWTKERKNFRVCCHQCDQIWQFIGLWATFQSLWQQLLCPHLPHSKAICVKVFKSLFFLVKSFLGNFFYIWRLFTGHTGRNEPSSSSI